MKSAPRAAFECVAVLFVSILAGCGGAFSTSVVSVDPSVTHTGAAGSAIDAAIDSLSIPGLSGRRISVTAENDRFGTDMLASGIAAMLVKKGAVPVASGGGSSDDARPDELRARLSSLRIVLDPGDVDKRGLILRIATVTVRVELADTGGVRRVYKAEGPYTDRIASTSMDSMGNGIHTTGSEDRSQGIVSYIKPVLIGVTMTVLAWSLFAYRG